MSDAAGPRLPTAQTVVYAVLLGLLFCAMTITAYIGFALIYPRAELVVTTQPIEVMTKTVRAGEALTLALEYCKAHERNSLGGLLLASRGAIIALPAYVSALPIGCHRVGLMYQVPSYTPPGSYKAYLAKEYRPTIFQEVQVLIETEEFHVVAR